MPSPATTILPVLLSLIAGRAMALDSTFDLEAHRGGRALLPENTLPAFANALSMGVDTLELDVGITADGEVVVSHERGLNPDITRDAGGTYVAAPGTRFVKLRLADVRTYDVGQIRPDSPYAKQIPDQLDRGVQPGRSRRVAAPNHQGCGRRDLVALFRRCDRGAGLGGARARAACRGLDGQQA